MADNGEEDSDVTCASEVRVVCRFSSNKGILGLLEVVRVHLAVYSESVFCFFFVQSFQSTACCFELV